MRQLTAQEWQRLGAAAQQGDRIAYWRVLQDAGDRYAFVAGQIVLGASFAGRVANNHLASVGGLNAQGVHAFGKALRMVMLAMCRVQSQCYR